MSQNKRQSRAVWKERGGEEKLSQQQPNSRASPEAARKGKKKNCQQICPPCSHRALGTHHIFSWSKHSCQFYDKRKTNVKAQCQPEGH